MFKGDIGIISGKIVCISKNENLKGKFEKEIDAKGKIVTPGLLDIHTHYDLVKTRKIIS